MSFSGEGAYLRFGSDASEIDASLDGIIARLRGIAREAPVAAAALNRMEVGGATSAAGSARAASVQSAGFSRSAGMAQINYANRPGQSYGAGISQEPSPESKGTIGVFGQLNNQMNRVIGRFIAFGIAIRGMETAFHFAESAVKSWIEEQRAGVRLAFAERRAGITDGGQGTRFAGAIETITGAKPSDTKDLLARALGSTSDMKEAQKRVMLAMDIEAAGHGDAGHVLDMMNKASSEGVGSLRAWAKSIGISNVETMTVSQVMQEAYKAFGGAAKAAHDAEGGFGQMHDSMQKLTESFGRFMAPWGMKGGPLEGIAHILDPDSGVGPSANEKEFRRAKRGITAERIRAMSVSNLPDSVLRDGVLNNLMPGAPTLDDVSATRRAQVINQYFDDQMRRAEPKGGAPEGTDDKMGKAKKGNARDAFRVDVNLRTSQNGTHSTLSAVQR